MDSEPTGNGMNLNSRHEFERDNSLAAIAEETMAILRTGKYTNAQGLEVVYSFRVKEST